MNVKIFRKIYYTQRSMEIYTFGITTKGEKATCGRKLAKIMDIAG